MSRRNSRSVLLVTVLLSLTVGWAGIRGQSTKTQNTEREETVPASTDFDLVARELLARPAPTPRLAETELGNTAGERPEEFFDPLKPPPENALVADLVDYWLTASKRNRSNQIPPTALVRERLLLACEVDPRILDSLLRWLPDAEGTADRVVQLYRGAAGNDSLSSGWHSQVENWLKFNSTLYVNDLAAESGAARDKSGGVQNEASLTSLAKVDRATAKPILLALAGTGQVRTEALAAALLFKIAVEEHDDENQTKYLRRLIAIAKDVSAPAKARDAAFNGLLRNEWSGRDEWYRAQFADKTLMNLGEGSNRFSPLLGPLEEDPDKWIPLLARFIESSDRDVRSNAGSALVQFVAGSPRRDAILPLLPWLGDPKLLKVDGRVRTSFIEKLAHVDVPECVPGLMWVVYFEVENRLAAANVLGHYQDRRAVPALSFALSYESVEGNQRALIGALWECGGIPSSYQLRAIESYVRKLMTKEGREELTRPRSPNQGPLPVVDAIGKFLAQRTEVPDQLAATILEQAESARRNDPLYADSLFEVASHWQVAPVDLALLRRVREGTANAEVIGILLDHRVRLQTHAAFGLQALAGTKGFGSGVAAVLAADDAQADRILAAPALGPKLALLVCARLVQQPLPVRAVAIELKSKNKLLAYAAERYLLAEDSREARLQLWERFPRQSYVTGWREKLGMFAEKDFSTTDQIETDLQQEMSLSRDAPLQLYALLDRTKRPAQILRMFRDRAVYTWNESDARYRERVVPINDRAAFLLYVANRNLTRSGPQFGACERDCLNFEFLAMNRSGARRMVMRSGPLNSNEMGLIYRFWAVGEGAKTHYRFEDTFSGVEVLIEDPTQKVKDVWQSGSDLRVRIERTESLEQREQAVREQFSVMAPGGAGNSGDQRGMLFKLRQILRERLAWYHLREGKLIPDAPRPAASMSADEVDLDLDPTDFSLSVNSRVGLATAGPVTVLAVAESPSWGLWEKRGTSRPQLIRAGPYRDPVVSPDGRWAVATKLFARNVRGLPGTNQLVRIKLGTEEEFPVDLPLSDGIEALAYLPTRLRFLVRVAQGYDQKLGEPSDAGFYLVDPVNGAAEPVTGNFTPLLKLSSRMLQRTSNPDEYWAALPDPAKLQTQVGRYNVNDFSFHPVMTIPYVAFDSQAMWVDEPNGKLLIVIDGQLVRMPLGPPVKAVAAAK